MLPWLMERGEVPVSEVTQRFDLTEAELVHDLELAAMCGLPPFVDEMIDVFIDEGTVYTGVPRVFTRPLRLTAPEGFALLAASRVAMQLPGADEGGALARALDKLRAALGPDAVVVDTPAPAAASDLAAAVDEVARLRIAYRSATADEATPREVIPRRVLIDRGHWYLIADDLSMGEERTFRIDRIESFERTGDFDEPRDVVAPAGDDWFAGSDLPTATLALDPSAAWVVERYPTRSVTATPDGWEVELTVANEAWLRELLLRVGTGARVLEPPEWRDLGSRTAAALLARYEAGGSKVS
jgi:proteasome accessory factor C